MPKFKIEKSIEINAPAARVRSAIQDYQQWSTWSPWLCMEPEASIDCQGVAATVGHTYSWEGHMVGVGRMELTEIVDNIDKMHLTFLKPFKSTASVEFETTEIDADTTQVNWRMDSGLPFFLFFMVGTMKTMIGMDYDRGLRLLKEYVETGAVTSKTEIIGIVDAPAINYAGVSGASDLADISESMQQSFTQLENLTEGKTTDDYAGAIYTNMNLKNQHCQYTVFAPVDDTTASASIKSCRALKVVHTGSYQHLGNAWATANTWQRHKKLKRSKRPHPFELYRNNPEHVAASELVTEIYLPVNG